MVDQKNVAIEFMGTATRAVGTAEPKLPDDFDEAVKWILKQDVSFLREGDYLKRDRYKRNDDHHDTVMVKYVTHRNVIFLEREHRDSSGLLKNSPF